MSSRKTAFKRFADNTCKQMTDLVLDYLNDTLSPTVKRDFRRHLRICPDCVGFLNTYKKTVAVTRSVKAEDIPVKVQQKLLEFLRARMRQTHTDS